jgi:hypothetical protein
MINEQKKNFLLIYTPQITNRLKYIFNFIFNQELGVDYELCEDIEFFYKSECNKFSYSDENPFPQFPFIEAHGLLQSEEIQKINIDIFIFENQKAFFKSGKTSFFPFDIFAASFYLISRYEEYLPFKADEHGRFSASESLGYKEGFLEEPLINIWINLFKINLLKEFPKLIFKPLAFRFISTIDIDNAYADLNKGLVRTSLSLAKLLSSFKINLFVEKIKVLRYIRQDEYDNYDYLDQIHKKYGFEPVYFILYSKYSQYDKNLSQKNLAFKRLIQRISANYEVGMHPSYCSNHSIKILIDEKKLLEKNVKHQITKSRQHFLKFKLPYTFENLIKLDIKTDFSMGYSSLPGFRASVCSPFKFFNLITNRETELSIVPFAVMDVCFKHNMQIKPEEALKKIKKIITSVKKVNGLFVSLWHNETLNSTNGQMSWREVFEQMLHDAKNGN